MPALPPDPRHGEFHRLGSLTLRAIGRCGRLLARESKCAVSLRLPQFLRLHSHRRRTRHLIVFLVPGYDIVSGGVLSICSICTETRRLAAALGADTVICNAPGTPRLQKYTQFENSLDILDCRAVFRYFRHLQSILVHVPESYVNRFAQFLEQERPFAALPGCDVHVNILLQNIRLLEGQDYSRLAAYGRLTFTTAHDRYSTAEVRRQLGHPLHKLSVFISPEQYHKVPYAQKEDLIVVSPDPHEKREEILAILQRELPRTRLVTIKGLKYEAYKELISSAKWGITFGEGLDGYFIEPVFSGGISFAVYNEAFFTPDFKGQRTIYRDYGEMATKLVDDIRSLDNPAAYAACTESLFAVLSRHYAFERYRQNIADFYAGSYTYP